MPSTPRSRSESAASERAAPRRARGRPRSERARRDVLEATRALFEEGGYPAATIEAIAERSGVAKTTIYRWWHNRPTLVVELLLQVAATAAPLPTGRDPMKAIRTELHRVTTAADALPGRLLLSLLSEAQRDEEVRTALIQGLFDPRRQATAKVIGRAQAAGALKKSVPPLVAVDLLFGPLFYRRFVRQEHVSRDYVEEVYRHVLAGLAPHPVRAAAKRAAGRRATAAAGRRPTSSGGRRARRASAHARERAEAGRPAKRKGGKRAGGKRAGVGRPKRGAAGTKRRPAKGRRRPPR